MELVVNVVAIELVCTKPRHVNSKYYIVFLEIRMISKCIMVFRLVSLNFFFHRIVSNPAQIEPLKCWVGSSIEMEVSTLLTCGHCNRRKLYSSLSPLKMQYVFSRVAFGEMFAAANDAIKSAWLAFRPALQFARQKINQTQNSHDCYGCEWSHTTRYTLKS